MKILSVRENPDMLDTFIRYFQKHWATENSLWVYDDCIRSCIGSENPLPQWYLLTDECDNILGCAGLITNDFISRMDLYPWLCALYVEEKHRGRAYGSILIDHIKHEAYKFGFKKLNLCTDHVGYYEKYGFSYIGTGYHPWGETSRIYQSDLREPELGQ